MIPSVGPFHFKVIVAVQPWIFKQKRYGLCLPDRSNEFLTIIFGNAFLINACGCMRIMLS